MVRKYLSLLALSLVILGSATGCERGQSTSTPVASTNATSPPSEPAPEAEAPAAEASTPTETANQKVKYAIIKTTLGTIKLELLPDQAPKTVDNFVQLAEGTKAWKLPSTGKMVKKPF